MSVKIQGITKAIGVTSKYMMPLFFLLFVGCGTPKKYTQRNRTRYNTPYQADVHTNSSENKPDNVHQQGEDQDCPICCSENALTDHGRIRCNACGKSICQTCYQNIQNAHNTDSTHVYGDNWWETNTFRTKKCCPFCKNENF